MQPFDEVQSHEPDPVAAIRQYPLIVLASVICFGLLGALFASTRPPAFTATAGLVVEDARVSSLFDSRSGDAERYVADQVAILESGVVATRASALAADLDPPVLLTVDALQRNATVTFGPDSNFIEITFLARDEVSAQAGANSIGLAYQELVSTALAEDSQTAIDRLDDAIGDTVAEIGSLQIEIEAARADSVERVELDDQLRDIVAELVEIRGAGNTVGEIQDLTLRAQQLTAELESRLLVSDVEARLPKTALLLRQQQDAALLLSELTLQRSQIAVDAQLAGNGVAFFATASVGESAGIPLRPAVALSSALGAVLGAGMAYVRSTRRRPVDSRLAPQRVLGVPMLADIPVGRRMPRVRWFGDRGWVRDPTAVPVLEDPTSARADAFRVLVSAIQRHIRAWRDIASGGDGYDHRGIVVAAVAATHRHNRTLVAVNTAFAAGRAGMRVALVDADGANQDVSRLMAHLEEQSDMAGVIDLSDGTGDFDDMIGYVDVGEGNRVDVMAVGDFAMPAPDVLAGHPVTNLLDRLADTYDLIVVDVPLVLDGSYATTLQQADSGIVITSHGEPMSDLEELRTRMSVIGVPLLGYVYMDSASERALTHSDVPTPRTAAHDDLKVIKGIGPAIEEILHEAGIETLNKLAGTSPARLRAILKGAGAPYSLTNPDDWPYQATVRRASLDARRRDRWAVG